MAAPTDALFWKKTSTLMAAQATIPTLLHARQVTFSYLQLRETLSHISQPNYLIALWNKQIKSHIFDPAQGGEGMHATTAVLDAADQGLAQDLSVQAGDWDTKLLDLHFEDENGRPVT